jgi:hypothetical protein
MLELCNRRRSQHNQQSSIGSDARFETGQLFEH